MVILSFLPDSGPKTFFQETMSNSSEKRVASDIHCMIHTIKYCHRKYRCLVYHWRQQLLNAEIMVIFVGEYFWHGWQIIHLHVVRRV